MTDKMLQVYLDKTLEVISMQEQLLEKTNKVYQELLLRSEKRIGNVNNMMTHLSSISKGFQTLCADLEKIYKAHIQRVSDSRTKAEQINLNLSESLRASELKYDALVNKFFELASKQNTNINVSQTKTI